MHNLRKRFDAKWFRVIGELEELIEKALEIKQRRLFGIGFARHLVSSLGEQPRMRAAWDSRQICLTRLHHKHWQQNHSAQAKLPVGLCGGTVSNRFTPEPKDELDPLRIELRATILALRLESLFKKFIEHRKPEMARQLSNWLTFFHVR